MSNFHDMRITFGILDYKGYQGLPLFAKLIERSIITDSKKQKNNGRNAGGKTETRSRKLAAKD